jgi:hypothetical protein
MGNNKPANGLLMYDGEYIPEKEAGPYEVTFNISTPGNYSYRLKEIQSVCNNYLKLV